MYLSISSFRDAIKRKSALLKSERKRVKSVLQNHQDLNWRQKNLRTYNYYNLLKKHLSVQEICNCVEGPRS